MHAEDGLKDLGVADIPSSFPVDKAKKYGQAFEKDMNGTYCPYFSSL
jgi:hypothetical protein